jgi:acetyl-CoA acetyltransferase
MRRQGTQFTDAWIPYGGYWSSPFCAWQGSFSTQATIPFAATIAVRALQERSIDPGAFDGICLGTTIPSRHSLYGAAWLAGICGLDGVTGPTINQACATSVRCLAHAAEELASEAASVYLVATADRTSNGPQMYYPDPTGPGGAGETENWVLDSFGRDPFAGNSMLQTAENVAREAGISRAAQEEVTLLRYRQYAEAVADGGAFHQRFLVSPVELRDRSGRKVVATVRGDEGVFPTTAEGLGRLKPVQEGGSVTFGTQTHPADGNAAVIVTRDRARAKAMSRDPQVEIRIVAFGQARVKKGYMPMAVVPAARQALERAGIGPADLASVTTHNPFAVNDVYLARELQLDQERMNRHGCSLVWGHPQGPTGLRSVIELVEDLVMHGGGFGLFTGCAAGDSAAAVVLEVLAA